MQITTLKPIDQREKICKPIVLTYFGNLMESQNTGLKKLGDKVRFAPVAEELIRRNPLIQRLQIMRKGDQYYQGEFDESKQRHGLGIGYWKRGLYYGSWKSDQPTLGLLILACCEDEAIFQDANQNDNIYKEMQVEVHPEEQSSMKSDDTPNICYYFGNFQNKKYHGYGEMYWQNGDIYRGNWKENKRHSINPEANQMIKDQVETYLWNANSERQQNRYFKGLYKEDEKVKSFEYIDVHNQRISIIQFWENNKPISKQQQDVKQKQEWEEKKRITKENLMEIRQYQFRRLNETLKRMVKPLQELANNYQLSKAQQWQIDLSRTMIDEFNKFADLSETMHEYQSMITLIQCYVTLNFSMKFVVAEESMDASMLLLQQYSLKMFLTGQFRYRAFQLQIPESLSQIKSRGDENQIMRFLQESVARQLNLNFPGPQLDHIVILSLQQLHSQNVCIAFYDIADAQTREEKKRELTNLIQCFQLSLDLFDFSKNEEWEGANSFVMKGWINGVQARYYVPLGWIGYGLKLPAANSNWFVEKRYIYLYLCYDQDKVTQDLLNSRSVERDQGKWKSECRHTGRQQIQNLYLCYVLTDKPQIAEKYAGQVELPNQKKQRFTVQCHVSNESLISPKKDQNFFITENIEHILPVRLIIKEIQ